MPREGAYLKELNKFHIVQVLLAVVPEVQPDELAVPVKGDVVMDNSLSENLLDIFLKGKRKTNQSHRSMSHPIHCNAPTEKN